MMAQESQQPLAEGDQLVSADLSLLGGLHGVFGGAGLCPACLVSRGPGLLGAWSGVRSFLACANASGPTGPLSLSPPKGNASEA